MLAISSQYFSDEVADYLKCLRLSTSDNQLISEAFWNALVLSNPLCCESVVALFPDLPIPQFILQFMEL